MQPITLPHHPNFADALLPNQIATSYPITTANSHVPKTKIQSAHPNSAATFVLLQDWQTTQAHAVPGKR